MHRKSQKLCTVLLECNSFDQRCDTTVLILWRGWRRLTVTAWIGFSTANDCQKIAAFIWRSKHTGFCPSHLDDFNSLCGTADTQQFTKILLNSRHVLQALLPPPADRNYNLRDRLHNRQLPGRISHLTGCNFIVRMLFCDSYWLYCFVLSFIVQLRFDNCCIKETFDLIDLIDISVISIVSF